MCEQLIPKSNSAIIYFNQATTVQQLNVHSSFTMSWLWCTALNRHPGVIQAKAEPTKPNTAAIPRPRFEILS